MANITSTIELNAINNTKSAFNQVSNDLNKVMLGVVDTKDAMNNFQKTASAMAQSINMYRQELAGCKQGTLEYKIASENLAMAVQKERDLFAQSAQKQAEMNSQYKANLETYNQEQQAIQKEIQAKQQETQATQQVKEAQASWSASTKYCEEQLKAINEAIATETARMVAAAQQYGVGSEAVKEHQDVIKDLEKEQSKWNSLLKDSKANMSGLEKAFDEIKTKASNFMALFVGKSLVNFAVNGISQCVSAIWEMGVAVDGVKMSFDELTERGGMDSNELLSALQTASHGMINNMDLMQSANTAMSLGIGTSIESMSDLMKVATIRAEQMGEDVSKAYEDIVTGVARLSSQRLDNLGIVVSLSDAEAEYAAQIGKSVDQLTKQEQQQAMLNAVMKQSKTELELREQQILSIPQKFQIMKASVENDAINIGNVIVRTLEPLFDTTINILQDIEKETSNMLSNIDGSTNNFFVVIGQLLTSLYENVKNTVGNIWSATQNITSNIANVINWLGSSLGQLFGFVENDGGNSVLTFGQIFSAVFQKLGQTVELFSIMINQLTAIIKRGTGNVVNYLGAIGKGIKAAMKPGVEIGNMWAEFNRGFGTAEEIIEVDTVENLLNTIKEDYIDFGAEVIQQEQDLANSWVESQRYMADHTFSVADLFGGNDNTTTSSGGSNSDKETEKEKEEKELIKSKYDAIKEGLKSAQEGYEDAISVYDDLWNKASDIIDDNQKKIEDLEDELKDLEEDLEDLNKELDDLYTDRTISVGDSLLGSQDTIDKFYYQLGESERRLEKMKEVANELSYQDIKILEWKDTEKYMGYAVDDLKELKQALDNISSYEGLVDKEGIEDMEDLLEAARKRENASDITNIEDEFEATKKNITDQIAELDTQIQNKQLEIINLQTEIASAQEAQTLLLQGWGEEIGIQRENYHQRAVEKLEYEREHQKELDLTYVALNQNTKELQSQEKIMRQMLEEWREMHSGSSGSSDNSTGHRAGGGVVNNGESYIVGEHGPELFVPSQSGKIIPNNQITNNNGEISININGVSVRSDEDIELLTNEIIRQIKLEKQFGIS